MQSWEVKELCRSVHFQARTGLCDPRSFVCGAGGSKPGPSGGTEPGATDPAVGGGQSPGPRSLQTHRACGHGPSACCSVRYSLTRCRAPVFSCLKPSSSSEISTLVRSGGHADDQRPLVKQISHSPPLTSPRNAFCAFPSLGWPPIEALLPLSSAHLPCLEAPVQLDMPASMPALRSSPFPLTACPRGRVEAAGWSPWLTSRRSSCLAQTGWATPNPSLESLDVEIRE